MLWFLVDLVSSSQLLSALPPLVRPQAGLRLHHKILRGNSTLGPRWDPAQLSCFLNRLVGSSGRGDVGLPSPFCYWVWSPGISSRIVKSRQSSAVRHGLVGTDSTQQWAQAVYNTMHYSIIETTC